MPGDADRERFMKAEANPAFGPARAIPPPTSESYPSDRPAEAAREGKPGVPQRCDAASSDREDEH